MNEIMRRRRAIMGAGHDLSGYQMVEWIQPTANSNVAPTGVQAGPTRKVIVKVQKTETGDGRYVGAWTGSAIFSGAWGSLNNTGGSSYSTSPTVAGSDTMTEPQVFTGSRSASTNTNVVCFCLEKSVRLFHAEVYHSTNGDPVFVGEPCYRKSDGQIGLLDSVTGDFYPVVGEYTKGANI